MLHFIMDLYLIEYVWHSILHPYPLLDTEITILFALTPKILMMYVFFNLIFIPYETHHLTLWAFANFHHGLCDLLGDSIITFLAYVW